MEKGALGEGTGFWILVSAMLFNASRLAAFVGRWDLEETGPCHAIS